MIKCECDRCGVLMNSAPKYLTSLSYEGGSNNGINDLMRVFIGRHFCANCCEHMRDKVKRIIARLE